MPASSVPVPRLVVPSRNVTVPLAAVGETVAVSVTAVPAVVEVAELVSAVVVAVVLVVAIVVVLSELHPVNKGRQRIAGSKQRRTQRMSFKEVPPANASERLPECKHQHHTKTRTEDRGLQRSLYLRQIVTGYDNGESEVEESSMPGCPAVPLLALWTAKTRLLTTSRVVGVSGSLQDDGQLGSGSWIPPCFDILSSQCCQHRWRYSSACDQPAMRPAV